MEINFTLYPKIYILKEDFEDDSGGLEVSGDWEWGTPTSGPETAHSGSMLLGTNLSGSYSASSDSRLIISNIDLTGVVRPIFSLYHWYNIESFYDGGNVKISINNAPWRILNSLNPPYNEERAFWANVAIPDEPCYSGNEQGYWEEVTRNLSAYEDSVISIMFHFGSNTGTNTNPGWFIDDICIYYLGDSTLRIPSVYSMKIPGITSANEFNINYSLPEGESVTFRVFDCSGRIIKSASEVKGAGLHSTRIDMVNKPSGIYFITIKAGIFRDTKKIILIR